MPVDVGTQTVTIKYFDPADSAVLNRIGVDGRKTGIYTGGYLTKVSDVSVTLSVLTCEISDGTYQVRVKTASVVTIAVGAAVPYVVLRWAYTGSAANDYMDFVAVALGGILATDLVVGQCTFAGATLTGFVYTLRSTPSTMDLFLKVEPTIPASLKVRVRAGRINYGSANYDIVDQDSPLFVAPGAGTRIDALQVNAAGALIVTQGTAVAPDYGGLVTLAEITLGVGQTTITVTSIKDVRAFGSAYPTSVQFVALTGNQTVAGTKSFSTPIAIDSGGTGQATAPLAINALAPTQAGNTGKSLVTNGSVVAWGSATYAA